MYNKNAWEKYSKDLTPVTNFAEKYKEFLSLSKTERECVNECIKLAQKYGFKDINELKEIKTGDKIYAVNKNKNIALFIIGKKPLKEGLRILGAHIDSPRIDIKQNPLYESSNLAYLDTHYYGGIKKYQWVTIPLAIHGVVVKKNLETVNVVIGESDDDPILAISDLLVHLSKDQLSKTADKVIEGENLDILIGNMPLEGSEKKSVKANILKLLKEKYNIIEEDFVSAELEVVPSGKARDLGLDRSMIAGYGHDDKVCAYTSLMAILEGEVREYTSCTFLVDKEEIGSVGATGAESLYFENLVYELLEKQNEKSYLEVRKCLKNSKMLSSDVSAGLDPLYKSAFESNNTCYLGNGIVFNKFTGSRGKSGCNDASPEFIAEIRNILDESNVYYQTSELGKVDQGGGGTIAYIMAKYNMEVVDAGVAVLSMHAPMEIVSKVDVYEAYIAYKKFLELK